MFQPYTVYHQAAIRHGHADSGGKGPGLEGEMDQPDDRGRDIEVLEQRLSRLSEASRRINESLDFDAVLQGGSWTPPGPLRPPPTA